MLGSPAARLPTTLSLLLNRKPSRPKIGVGGYAFRVSDLTRQFGPQLSRDATLDRGSSAPFPLPESEGTGHIQRDDRAGARLSPQRSSISGDVPWPKPPSE